MLQKTPSIELLGTFHKCDQITDRNGFKNQVFYLCYDDSYNHNGTHVKKTNYPAFQIGDKLIDRIANFKQGDSVKIKYSPQGIKYRRKEDNKVAIFSINKCFFIENLSATIQPPPSGTEYPISTQTLKKEVNMEEVYSDDLPF